MFKNWFSTVKEQSGGFGNKYRVPRCDDEGNVLVALTGGGDATAANQALQLAEEEAINTALGLKADVLATDSTGSWSAIALFKGIIDVLLDVKTAYNASHSLSDFALRTSAVIHGESTAGGGAIVSVKVTPSGALATNSEINYPVTALSSGLANAITTGGVAQNIIAADAAGYHYFVKNLSNETLWISTLATAVAASPSIPLEANGGWYETPDSCLVTGALSIIGATTGSSFVVRDW